MEKILVRENVLEVERVWVMERNGGLALFYLFFIFFGQRGIGFFGGV